MDEPMIFVAKYLILLPIGTVGVYFLFQPYAAKKRMVTFAVPAAALSYLVGLVGNLVYFDPRPFVVGHFTPLILHVPDNGFPSDHTLLVSTVAAMSMYWNRKLGLLLWAIAIIVAVARVYVGLHHPMDVIGSMIIAMAAVSAAYWFFKYVWHQEII
jgi:undecaprenyl-diphosphatase